MKMDRTMQNQMPVTPPGATSMIELYGMMQDNTSSARASQKHNDPTERTYSQLRRAYDFFNERLFGNKLPEALITLRTHGHSYGYFARERFADLQANKHDEIALNAQHFGVRTMSQTLSTLVHEMVHLEQYHFGKPGRRGYHNREWADLMEARGLIASNTGAPGGKRTGQQMTHYIVDGGPYDPAYRELVAGGFDELLADVWRGPDRKKSESKTKFTCPKCRQNAWGAPTIEIDCHQCLKLMKAADA
jgi:hypothetical protein